MEFFLICIGYLSKLDTTVFWIEEALDVHARYANDRKDWLDFNVDYRRWSAWPKETPAGSRA